MKFLKEVFSKENIIIVGVVFVIGGMFYTSFLVKEVKDDALEMTDHIKSVVDTVGVKLGVVVDTVGAK
ncbi:hypothetical protein KAR91_85885, partial [Candidatus Pacearchaeota archaeon]|nr:hypothetical protein [Candidatus Pacearchaeota archaeon]